MTGVLDGTCLITASSYGNRPMNTPGNCLYTT